MRNTNEHSEKGIPYLEHILDLISLTVSLVFTCKVLKSDKLVKIKFSGNKETKKFYFNFPSGNINCISTSSLIRDSSKKLSIPVGISIFKFLFGE